MTRTAAACTLVATLALPSMAAGQPPQPAAPDRAKVISVARDVMQSARYCTLVTIGEDGHPQARIVDTFPPEADMTVWIATKPVTRKVAQIQKDPRVTLTYFDPGSESYVTLLGRATLVRDAAEKTKRWKDEWAPLYSDKNRGDDYLLLRVTVSRLEVSSETRGVTSDAKTWRPAVIDLK